MKLESFDQVFSGEFPAYSLYIFTPDPEHDPDQAAQPWPRVMVRLDGFLVTPGMSVLMTRYKGAERTEQLPDHVAAVLGPICNRLVNHLKHRLDTDATNPIITITRVISETSVKGPHTLLIPTRNRAEPPKTWQRTYTDDDPTRATPEELEAMQKTLAIPAELKEDLDRILGDVYWSADEAASTAE